jgi:predicted O-methyltransferase YrrM
MTSNDKELNFFFPDDGSEIWLARMDAELALFLLKHVSREGRGGRPAQVLEIGVWKGAWTSIVLVNVPEAQAFGVDPYPGRNSDVRRIMENRLESLGVHDRFVLTAAVNSLPPHQEFDVIHIDGEHSEAAVWSDLTFALSRLAVGGVIIVDDFRHAAFPGIPSALFRFLEANDLRVFLASANKAYVARACDASTYYDEVLAAAQNFRHLMIQRHFGDGDPKSQNYAQPTDVLGQPVLLAAKPTRSEDRGEVREAESVLRRTLKALMPPILVDAYRSARWRQASNHRR